MIALIGATGFTGRLIARELARGGAAMRLAARSLEKLESLRAELKTDCDIAQIDVTEAKTFAPSFEGATVIVNCAGPFTDLGEPVVKESLRRGAHYIDTTGEQAFIRTVYDNYDEEAQRKNIVLVPACAFEYAIGDVAASLAADGFERCDTVDIIYDLRGFGSSRGTKKSIMRAISNPGYLLRDGRLERVRPAATRRRVEIPGRGIQNAYSFPGGEVLMVPRRSQVGNVTTFLVNKSPSLALLALSFIGPTLLNSRLSKLIFKQVDKGDFGPSEGERAASRFTVVCEIQARSEHRRVVAEGGDPYGLTAKVAASVATFCLRNQPLTKGAVSPVMVAGRQFLIDCTTEAGVVWAAP